MTTKDEVEQLRAFLKENPGERENIVRQAMADGLADQIRQAATHVGIHRLLIAKGIVTVEEIEKAQEAAIPFVTKVNVAALVSDELVERESAALNHWLRTGETK